MKRSMILVVAWVLLMSALIPVLVSARGADRPERFTTAVLTRGQAIEIDAPAKDSVAPYVPSGSPRGLPRRESAAEKMGLPQAPQPQGVLGGLKETFESAWPAGNWATFDENGVLGGDVCWDDEDWIAHKGLWSAWGVGGCADGLNPYTDLYPNDTESWMVYGPFSTKRATTGTLTFKYWNESEFAFDYLYWCASVDGNTYYCKGHTGSTNDRWRGGKIDLQTVPLYGSMLGEDTVYVAWIFYSDYSITDKGPFVDDVKLSLSNSN